MLTDVGFQVEELHGVVLEVFQQLVVTHANGTAGALHSVIAVVREVPIDRVSIKPVVPIEKRNKADTIGMLLRLKRQVEHIENGRIQVGTNYRHVAKLSLFAMVGPMDDQRFSDSAFIEPTLRAA